MSLCFPGMHLARFRSLARRLYRISFTRELFPDPDTPVTQVMIPRGISTFTPFRLFSLAPSTFRKPVGARRSPGMGIASSPLRYFPVTDSGICMISSAVPQATTSPPWEPAPGPMSTT